MQPHNQLITIQREPEAAQEQVESDLLKAHYLALCHLYLHRMVEIGLVWVDSWHIFGSVHLINLFGSQSVRGQVHALHNAAHRTRLQVLLGSIVSRHVK